LGSSSRGKKISLKDFSILKELGEGKFGKVMLVQEKQSKFVSAMKVFKKAQIREDEFMDQFIREMKLQLYMNHPNVIKMYGYFDDLSNIYILM
jgi:aurora kinase, other